MTNAKGKVKAINGNLISVQFDGTISLNEVGYVTVDNTKLKSEVIRICDDIAQLQVYEMTDGVKVGDEVDFTTDLLSAELGPGLLTQIYDGLQNPLPELAEKTGHFLQRGVYVDPLPRDKKWDFTPVAKVGDTVVKADTLGTVPEGTFTHCIMVPFYLLETYKVKWIIEVGSYTIDEKIAELEDSRGKVIPITMSFKWPVKRVIDCYAERLMPTEPLVTKIRTIDTFFPVAKGGTYCIPGPFGAGKTVLQHSTSRNAEADIVIVVACGERAGEVVETITEFPEITDPKTGRSLMERTIIICNTSSMPVS